MYIFTM